MKAFLLAAGKGKRLLPFTKDNPKPLVKVGGVSLIERSINILKNANIEEIVINQSGSGYDSEIPPTVIIDGDGESGELNATVSSTGSIAAVNIVNSGINYTKDPRVILSHPQIYKKADYYVSLIKNVLKK